MRLLHARPNATEKLCRIKAAEAQQLQLSRKTALKCLEAGSVAQTGKVLASDAERRTEYESPSNGCWAVRHCYGQHCRALCEFASSQNQSAAVPAALLIDERMSPRSTGSAEPVTSKTVRVRFVVRYLLCKRCAKLANTMHAKARARMSTAMCMRTHC